MQNGKQNEIDIMCAFSGVQYEFLTDKWKKHMKKMFPDIQDKDVIHTYFYDDSKAKPDIVIRVNNKSVLVSIKSGHNPSCHLEVFSDFQDFLIKQGVPRRILKIISFYQFGESEKLSNNGVPFSREEIQTQFKQYIQEVNNYFLNNPELVKKIIYRSLIRGVRRYTKPIDFFYYGNARQGFLLSVDDIYNEIINDPYIECRAIHFFALVYQPDGRRLDRDRRLFVRIKWPILSRRFYEEDFLEKYS